MNILITGAGLIGCYGAQRLLTAGHRVVLFDVAPDRAYIDAIVGESSQLTVASGDVRDWPLLVALACEHDIDTVVHGAGLIAKKAAEHPYTGFSINVGGSVNVAEVVRLAKAKRLVFLSSFGAYNWQHPAQAPITEEHPLAGEGLYGAMKAANEHILGALADIHGFEVVFLRPAIVFGSGHFRGGSPGGMMMPELVSGAVERRPVRLLETLTGVNEYVYVKDMALALERACTVAKLEHRAFNVGMGVLTPVRELVERARALAPQARIELVPAAAGEKIIRRPQPLDLTRSRGELGYAPQYTIEKAFADYMRTLGATDIAA